MQPLDVGIKNQYKKEIRYWQEERYYAGLSQIPTRAVMVECLQKALRVVKKESIIHSFRHCGITPTMAMEIPELPPVVEVEFIDAWDEEDFADAPAPTNPEGDEE